MISNLIILALALAFGYMLGRHVTRKRLHIEADKWAHLVSDQVLLEAQAKTLEAFARTLEDVGPDQFAVPVRVATMLAQSYRQRAEEIEARP
jgi:hypothetical protein